MIERKCKFIECLASVVESAVENFLKTLPYDSLITQVQMCPDRTGMSVYILILYHVTVRDDKKP